ncbi:MAG: hypothetical protein IT383_03945 [Deltaproteobacteria bacterium]|nr:hypothetical protein [Deltaproteobacteria bacterium]
MLFAFDDDDHDDSEGFHALDVRALVEGAESRGAFLEIVRLRGAHVLEHRVLPPTGSARFDGVTVQGLGGGVALVDGRIVREGERVALPLDGGELWVRFAPAPRRLLPAEASRIAVVLLVIVACLASLSGVGARGNDAERANAGPPVAGAFERSHTRSARRRQRRALAARLRQRRRRAARTRRPRAARAQRPLRRGVPRRSAPDSDGGEGSDDDDERRGRALPRARARGPPR